jgi:peptide/nickel transport system substrate-binding protein
LAVAIKDQLRAVGIDATLETFSDINTTVATNAFDATLYSYGVAPFGDLGGAIGLLYTPSGTNKERYANAQVNTLFAQYNQTSDTAQREMLLGSMQKLIGQDVPVVYLVNPNQIVATSSRVVGYTPHPLENYKIDNVLGLQP